MGAKIVNFIADNLGRTRLNENIIGCTWAPCWEDILPANHLHRPWISETIKVKCTKKMCQINVGKPKFVSLLPEQVHALPPTTKDQDHWAKGKSSLGFEL